MRDPGFVRFERERVVLLGSDRHAFVLEEEDDKVLLRFGDGEHGRVPVASDWRPGEPVWTGTVGAGAAGNVPIAVQVRPILNGVLLSHAGASVAARVYTRREAELAALMPEKTAAGAGKQLLCPMPGLVKAILVKAGQEVKAGEPLAIVEAMKMENVLRAERDVSIAKVDGEGRRFARRRRGDPGVRVTPLQRPSIREGREKAHSLGPSLRCLG